MSQPSGLELIVTCVIFVSRRDFLRVTIVRPYLSRLEEWISYPDFFCF